MLQVPYGRSTLFSQLLSNVLVGIDVKPLSQIHYPLTQCYSFGKIIDLTNITVKLIYQ